MFQTIVFLVLQQKERITFHIPERLRKMKEHFQWIYTEKLIRFKTGNKSIILQQKIIC